MAWETRSWFLGNICPDFGLLFCTRNRQNMYKKLRASTCFPDTCPLYSFFSARFDYSSTAACAAANGNWLSGSCIYFGKHLGNISCLFCTFCIHVPISTILLIISPTSLYYLFYTVIVFMQVHKSTFCSFCLQKYKISLTLDTFYTFFLQNMLVLT